MGVNSETPVSTRFATPKYVLVCPASAGVTTSPFLPSWRSSQSPRNDYSPSLARRSLFGEQLAEAQTVGQLHQRLPVLIVGPDPAISPAPYGVAIGPQAAGDLRPRQARLFLEPLQPLREVLGEGVGSSVVAICQGIAQALPADSRSLTRMRAQASPCRRSLTLPLRPHHQLPVPSTHCPKYSLPATLPSSLSPSQ